MTNAESPVGSFIQVNIRRLLVLGLTAYFVSRLVTSVMKFNDRMVAMSTAYVTSKRVLYPSVTVCPKMDGSSGFEEEDFDQTGFKMTPVKSIIYGMDHIVEMENG